MKKKKQNKKHRRGFHKVAKSVLDRKFLNANAHPKTLYKHAYRAIFVSDIHLGSHNAKAASLLDFLNHHKSEMLYVVGDVVDGWRFKKRQHWPDEHTKVFHLIFEKAKNGTNVTFTPGNHDEMFHAYTGRTLRGVKIRRDVIHQTVDGRKFWVTHGDQFDKAAGVPEWMFHLGDLLNRALHHTNKGLNRVREKMGYAHWCLATHMKNNSKRAMRFKKRFVDIAIEVSRNKGVDGIICGHIHRSEQRTTNGIHYINTGDWVDGCTALVEHFDGKLEIIRWHQKVATKT